MKKAIFFILLFAEIVDTFSQEYIDIEIDSNKTDFVSLYSASVTHTQNSIDSWKNPQAAAEAKMLLENSTEFQNQHIMGWGCLNPWPDSTVKNPADWEWKTLDNRISLIRETNGKAIITLCGCPTWMHTPEKNGLTEWGTSLEKAPTPVHFDDFAHLCTEVARRYPDVVFYQVWNELKGFWNTSLSRWRYEDYTTMYNMIYDSLKALNNNIKIGGPYAVVSTYSAEKYFTSDIGGVYGFYDKRPLDVIEHWLQHKKGADFIALDGKLANKDGILNCDSFTAGNKFTDIISWIKQKAGNENLEIWWSEWYVNPGIDDPQQSAAFNNALMASTLIKTLKTGSSNVLLWQPEGDEQGFSFPLGLWTSTENYGGGEPTLFYYTSKILKENFSRGTEIVHSDVTSKDISVLASKEKILIVNHRKSNIKVRINNTAVISLVPYEVKLYDALLSEPVDGLKIRVIYNHINDILYLKDLKSSPEELKYSIFNQLGSVLQSGKKIVISEQSIELGRMQAGFYLYRFLYLNKVYSNKIIKLK